MIETAPGAGCGAEPVEVASSPKATHVVYRINRQQTVDRFHDGGTEATSARKPLASSRSTGRSVTS